MHLVQIATFLLMYKQYHSIYPHHFLAAGFLDPATVLAFNELFQFSPLLTS
jgi:hypothetical protein